jgi:hypothetical protein
VKPGCAGAGVQALRRPSTQVELIETPVCSAGATAGALPKAAREAIAEPVPAGR